MKWIYRLLTIALLGGAILFPFFTNNDEGKPMLSLPETKSFMPSSLTSGKTLPALPSSSQTFYKWQDEHGTWHYGDSPPANGPRFSTIEIDSNTNVIQSISIAPDPKPTATKGRPNTATSTDATLSNVISLERAMNVLNDAKNVQGLMDTHNAQLESATGNKQ